MTGGFLGFDRPTDLKSVHTRHSQVKYNNAGFKRRYERSGLETVMHLDYFVIGMRIPYRPGDYPSRIRLIIDYQDTYRRPLQSRRHRHLVLLKKFHKVFDGYTTMPAGCSMRLQSTTVNPICNRTGINLDQFGYIKR